MIKEYQYINFLPVELTYYFESKQGYSHARQRAIKEAKGELIAFLDDDNLPEINWLAETVIFAQKHPKAGAYNGKIFGKYETNPSEDFEVIKNHLSIREHGEQILLFEPDNLKLPPSAGLIVRKKAWIESVPENSKFKGIIGNLRGSGEDYEILLYLHKAGWEIWYNPSQKIEHYIPASRLEKQYLLTLAMSNGLAICQLRMINAEFWQVQTIFVKTFLGNLRLVVVQYLKHKQQLRNNFIAEFELKFYWGSVLSCFSWIRQELNLISRIKSD